ARADGRRLPVPRTGLRRAIAVGRPSAERCGWARERAGTGSRLVAHATYCRDGPPAPGTVGCAARRRRDPRDRVRAGGCRGRAGSGPHLAPKSWPVARRADRAGGSDLRCRALAAALALGDRSGFARGAARLAAARSRWRPRRSRDGADRRRAATPEGRATRAACRSVVAPGLAGGAP